MKFIFIKYFPSYEIQKLQSSISIGTLNLLTQADLRYLKFGKVTF